MGKMFNTMVIGMIITIALALFNGSGIAPTSLVLMLLNPNGWETSSFWSIFSVLTTLSGVIVIGIAAIIKQDWIFRAGVLTSLSSIVVAPFVDWFNYINSQLGYLGGNCVNAQICSQLNSIGGVGQFIAIIVAGIPLLWCLWNCISWVFSADNF